MWLIIIIVLLPILGFIGGLGALIENDDLNMLWIIIPCALISIALLVKFVKVFKESKVEQRQKQIKAELEYKQSLENKAKFQAKKEYIIEQKDLIQSLSNEFYPATKNYIESIYKKDFFELESFKREHYSIFYLFNKDELSSFYIDADGFPTKTNSSTDDSVKEKTVIYINGLISRLKEKWQDSDTLNAIVYIITKQNVIRYFHKKFADKFNCDSVEDLCNKYDKYSIDKSLYTYYHIFENNIDSPIGCAYANISKRIDIFLKEKENKDYENSLFENDNCNSSEDDVLRKN